MTSKISYDTNLLRVRELYAVNKTTNDFIQPFAVPITGNQGEVLWFSTIEFLSTITIPPTNIPLVDLLDQIQPGLSSLSTQNGRLFSTNTSTLTSRLVSSVANSTPPNFSTPMYSTVAGLGSAGYLSTVNIEINSFTTSNLILREPLFTQSRSGLYKPNALAYRNSTWVTGGQRDDPGSLSKTCIETSVEPFNPWNFTFTNFTKVNTICAFTLSPLNYFAAGGRTLTSTGTIQMSFDGVSWRSLETSLVEVYGLAFGVGGDFNPYLVAVGTKDGVSGAVQKTTDFSTFTEEVTSLTVGYDIVYDPQIYTFKAVGYSDGTTSANAIYGYPGSWSNETTTFTTGLSVATNGSNEFGALGVDALDGTIHFAKNFTGTWVDGETLYPAGSEYRLRYLSSTWIACGPSTIQYNYDASIGSWSNVTSFFGTPRDIAYDGSLFVAVGWEYNPEPSSTYYSTIAYSSTLGNFINTEFLYTASTVLQMSTNQVQVGSNILTPNPIFASTVTGLGSAGYLSTVQSEFDYSTISTYTLFYKSTLMNLSEGILAVSSQSLYYLPDFTSTVEGLGSLGYLSGITISTITGLQGLGYVRGDPSVVDDFYVSDLRLVQYGNNPPFAPGLVSTHVTTSSSTLFANSQPFVFTLDAVSTIDQLGNTYISSPTYLTDLTSTVAGLGTQYVSTLSLISSIDNLGSQGLISTASLTSTVGGLGQLGYFSTFAKEKTLYESTFPTLGTNILVDIDNFYIDIFDSNTRNGINLMKQNLLTEYTNGIFTGGQNKVRWDLFFNCSLYFDSPLVSDTQFGIRYDYAGSGGVVKSLFNTFTIPANTTQFSFDRLTLPFQEFWNFGYVTELTILFIFLGGPIPGKLSFSMAPSNSLFVTIDNMN